MSGASVSGAYIASTGQISSTVQSALSEWIWVSTTTLAAPAQNITISGLTGDTDGFYRIMIDAVAGTTTASSVTATINNDGGANYTYQYFIGGAAASAARAAAQTSINTAILQLDSDNNANNNGSLEFILRCPTGVKRRYEITGQSGFYINFLAGAYLETATNITRVDLLGSAADCFGIGTKIRLYKRAV